MFQVIVLAENEIIERVIVGRTEAEENAALLSRDHACTAYVKNESKIICVYERGELD